MIPEVSSVTPGKTFTIALKLEHPENWHSYYLNSGGGELPPKIKWTLPKDASAGSIQWPVPSVKDSLGSKSFIYAGSPVFLVDITPPASLGFGDTFTFTANATWQICDEQCIPEKAEFTIDLPVSQSPVISEEHIALFAAARQSIPKKPDSKIEFHAASARKSQDIINLEIKGLSTAPKDFIPNQPYLRSLSDRGKITPTEEGFAITLQRKRIDAFDNPIEQGKTVSGILIGETNITVPETMISSPPPEPVSFLRPFLSFLS
jgi:thiol:disulfide interchange protein DsbD